MHEVRERNRTQFKSTLINRSDLNRYEEARKPKLAPLVHGLDVLVPTYDSRQGEDVLLGRVVACGCLLRMGFRHGIMYQSFAFVLRKYDSLTPGAGG
jgi:hypothetical protein